LRRELEAVAVEALGERRLQGGARCRIEPDALLTAEGLGGDAVDESLSFRLLAAFVGLDCLAQFLHVERLETELINNVLCNLGALGVASHHDELRVWKHGARYPRQLHSV